MEDEVKQMKSEVLRVCVGAVAREAAFKTLDSAVAPCIAPRGPMNYNFV